MEAKELKIQIPEGYEIDKENSTFECVKFKPISINKDITYADVCNSILTDKTTYFINYNGAIGCGVSNHNVYDKNNATNRKQLKRLLALNQLLNIAEYYNKLHKLDNISVIKYDNIRQIYVAVESCDMYTRGIRAIFNRLDDAQAVIDNPNFREILDAIYKD